MRHRLLGWVSVWVYLVTLLTMAVACLFWVWFYVCELLVLWLWFVLLCLLVWGLFLVVFAAWGVGF